MGKKIRLTESELISLIKKVISEQDGGPDTEILMSLEDMGFDKKNCKNYIPKSEKLSWEYCHNQKPYIVVSYPSPYNVIEILDTKNMKRVETIENPNVVDLEATIKSYFGY